MERLRDSNVNLVLETVEAPHSVKGIGVHLDAQTQINQQKVF